MRAAARTAALEADASQGFPGRGEALHAQQHENWHVDTPHPSLCKRSLSICVLYLPTLQETQGNKRTIARGPPPPTGSSAAASSRGGAFRQKRLLDPSAAAAATAPATAAAAAAAGAAAAAAGEKAASAAGARRQ